MPRNSRPAPLTARLAALLANVEGLSPAEAEQVLAGVEAAERFAQRRAAARDDEAVAIAAVVASAARPFVPREREVPLDGAPRAHFPGGDAAPSFDDL